MHPRTAKEYLQVQDWPTKASLIVSAGREEYNQDELLQEAGDSLMMKIGEAANRLRRAGEPEPAGLTWARVVANRNWIIHQYDQIDRDITWSTLESLWPELDRALRDRFAVAQHALSP
ncbi:DUF86 domain-containing protein [Humibacillus sp. DSM 29435]|uniref:HepT-like ribonuclease domain-containing protein n=1 Tax=Humibacillus sp. DSM 29435 TaxID=1869167 RepID=UPI0020C7705F|nr:HepT-like ribonuclease domain-containing protein [Humibacillus sp. DSM 29435]